MKVTKQSALSGKVNTREIAVTAEQLAEIGSPSGRVIQSIVPHLSPEDREFLLTGITPDEWDATFGEEED